MTENDWKGEPDLDELRRLHAVLQKSPQEALLGLDSLANRGSVMSMLYLGDTHANMHNIDKAKSWYRRASDMGSTSATHALAHLYLGQGETQDAFAAFSKGAALGYLPSIYTLSTLYADGRGTVRDLDRCRMLLEEAAARGHLFAKRDLAILYIGGGYGFTFILKGVAMLIGLYFLDLPRELLRAIRHRPSIGDRMKG